MLLVNSGACARREIRVIIGKLVQKLLAIAICEAGATKVTERSTQGTDLAIVLADKRAVALEVKTSQDGEVSFGKKDIDGLESRRREGMEPHFALLGSRMLDEWIFARSLPGEIREKKYRATQLRAYRNRELEAIVRETFPVAVVAHGAAATNGGQGALDQVLRRYDCYELA